MYCTVVKGYCTFCASKRVPNRPGGGHRLMRYSNPTDPPISPQKTRNSVYFPGESLKDETVEAVIAGGCDKLSSSQGYTLQVKETINQIKWDAFISKVVEIRVDIEISNNLITKLDFSNVTTFDSKSKLP